MVEGVAGLLRDKTRPPGAPPLAKETLERVVELTRGPPSGEATHWTGRAMAKVVDISLSAVQGIWKAHGLVLYRVRTFKLSRDLEFVTKLRDVVGLHVPPPAHSLVLSVDEKSQIQDLDRTQPGLPMVESGAFDGPARHRDARLCAPRHDHAVRGLEHPRRDGGGPLP